MKLSMIVVVTLAGCAEQASERPLERLDLHQAMAAASVDPVGVAVTPNGDRFVFDKALGLYRIAGDTAVAVVPMSAMPDPGTPLQLPFTDLVAVGPNTFALTAIGDGFLLDTSAMTLTQHFCYVPDGTPTYLTQHSDAIAFDPQLGRLYAQPVTIDDRGVFQWSQLAAYDRATGTDVEWTTLGESVAATAMTVLPSVGLVLGQGARLSRVDGRNHMVEVDDLTRFGVQSIDGLAVDSAAGSLLVVDGTSGELVEIELARLAL